MENAKLSTENYKGVRDFYPPDMFVQNYIFGVMKKTAESFGYLEYGASILEPAELYKAKSGQEIVNEQTYSFTDRGEREVTLRPEMTPTVARMVARNRKELSLPLRWYSIPNLFRYENPQRGRLREHWQLNVDLFGVKSCDAEIEMISIAAALMRAFGAKESDFRIKINNRKIFAALYDYFELSETESYALSKLIDKKEKMSREAFISDARELLGGETEEFISILSAQSVEELTEKLPSELQTHAGLGEIETVLAGLRAAGIGNAELAPTLMRGFDYYTGIVFELFDTDSKNRRSLFGGGRYDDLLDIFGAEKVTAVGFGMGDVTIRDFLETHGLLPAYRSTVDIALCRADETPLAEINAVADTIRRTGVNVSVDISGRKLGDQIKAAAKQAIPFVVVIGGNEIKNGLFKVKQLSSGAETELKLADIASFIKSHKA